MLSSQPVRASAAWMSRGACHGVDPEMFFPIGGTGPALAQISAARAICAGCTVRQPCLHYAAATMQDGIWGGTTAEERRVLRRIAEPLLNARARGERETSMVS